MFATLASCPFRIIYINVFQSGNLMLYKQSKCKVSYISTSIFIAFVRKVFCFLSTIPVLPIITAGFHSISKLFSSQFWVIQNLGSFGKGLPPTQTPPKITSEMGNSEGLFFFMNTLLTYVHSFSWQCKNSFYFDRSIQQAIWCLLYKKDLFK